MGSSGRDRNTSTSRDRTSRIFDRSVEVKDSDASPLAAAHAWTFSIDENYSVIPYVFGQLAMIKLPRSTYALFVALLPTTAVIIGAIVLSQFPLTAEVVAVGLVVAGVAVHSDPAQ